MRGAARTDEPEEAVCANHDKGDEVDDDDILRTVGVQ